MIESVCDVERKGGPLTFPVGMHSSKPSLPTVVCSKSKLLEEWASGEYSTQPFLPFVRSHCPRLGQHILAHSLGSALAAHILSDQPTTQPPLEDFTLEEIKQKSKSQFIFNTSSLFMIGSPLGVFLHLNQAQLIARKVTD